MKTHTIRAVDLKVGMYVIVEEWFEARGAQAGIPLKVVGLALPLMTVQHCAHMDIRGVMDTRQMRLTRVDLAYVRSLLPEFNPRKKALPPPEPRAVPRMQFFEDHLGE